MAEKQPRLMHRTFENNCYNDACEDASVFVEKIPGGRENFHSITTTYRHYGISYVVTVWYWRW